MPDAPTVPSIDKTEIVAGLAKLRVEPGSRLFVHSSLRAFGHVDGGAETVCSALLEAVGGGGTVALPTFTWPENHDKEIVSFDVARSPCPETGRIPDTFRRLQGAMRSEHICHSVAAIGPLAPDLMGEGVLPFGPGSSMYRLYELDFLCVFIGCGFASCTALHTVEELAAVGYRYYRAFPGSTVIRADGSRIPSRSVEFLRYLPFRNDFGKMEQVYRDRGVLRDGRIGAADVLIGRARDIVDIGLELVRGDPGYLLTRASHEYLTCWTGPRR